MGSGMLPPPLAAIAPLDRRPAESLRGASHSTAEPETDVAQERPKGRMRSAGKLCARAQPHGRSDVLKRGSEKRPSMCAQGPHRFGMGPPGPTAGRAPRRMALPGLFGPESLKNAGLSEHPDSGRDEVPELLRSLPLTTRRGLAS